MRLRFKVGLDVMLIDTGQMLAYPLTEYIIKKREVDQNWTYLVNTHAIKK